MFGRNRHADDEPEEVEKVGPVTEHRTRHRVHRARRAAAARGCAPAA